MTKRTLITVSHAIEQAAVASVATADEPVVLIALFQRPLYFDRERAAYRELSRSATLTIVGVVDEQPDVPPGVEGVALAAEEPLAAEWSVVMLTPRAGAALVALDREDVAPGEATIEKGRLFRGWWSFARLDAQAQVERLVDLLGDRLSRRARTIIDDVLAEANDRRSSPTEERTRAALELFVQHVERANRRVRQLESQAEASEHDPLTLLPTRSFLRTWIGGGAHSASGTLPVALVLLDVNRLRDVNEWSGRDAGDEVLKRVATTIRMPLREVDQAFRLDDDDFLLVLPGMSLDQTTRLAYRLCADIATMRVDSASVTGGVTASAAVTVTRERPLPLADLADVLRAGKAEALSVSVLRSDEAPAGAPAPRRVERLAPVADGPGYDGARTGQGYDTLRSPTAARNGDGPDLDAVVRPPTPLVADG